MERTTDAELARRCRRGDSDAWRELVQRFTPLAYRLAVRMLSDTSEASDVTQEVFMRVHQSLDSYDPTRPLAPWVTRITYNASLKRLDKTRRKGAIPMDPQDFRRLEDMKGENPEGSLRAREAEDHLLVAMEQLSSQDRALLVLRYREGFSDAEVAESVGMPVNTVKTRIFRARRALKDILVPMLGGD